MLEFVLYKYFIIIIITYLFILCYHDNGNLSSQMTKEPFCSSKCWSDKKKKKILEMALAEIA